MTGTQTYRRALVTGASSGIGEAYARRLAGRGTALVLVARREQRLHALAAELPVEVEVLAADLASPEGRAPVVERLARGDVDLVVNNAGAGTSGPLATVDAAVLAAEVELDVQAVLALTRAALPPMLAAGHGAVVNVASIVAYNPSPRLATYAAGKAFVLHLSRSVAAELGGTGVQVQALCPGVTRTEFHRRAGLHVRRLPGFVLAGPDEVVAASVRGLERGAPVVVPGGFNRLFVGATRFGPRWAIRWATGVVQRWRTR
jgi:short-subunit dehydrogenase